MTDDIRTLTTRLAEEPGSLAFLELAEALRRRGQLEAAAKVARGGLGRYPGLADAHDLLARVLTDQGDLAGAFDAWADALRIDPLRTGALKGIAFLYFRAGDTPAAIAHLQRASEADPDDESIAQALARVRREARAMAQPAPEPAPPQVLAAEPAAVAEPRGSRAQLAVHRPGGRRRAPPGGRQRAPAGGRPVGARSPGDGRSGRGAAGRRLPRGQPCHAAPRSRRVAGGNGGVTRHALRAGASHRRDRAPGRPGALAADGPRHARGRARGARRAGVAGAGA